MGSVTVLDATPAVGRDVVGEVASLAGVLNATTARLVETVAVAIVLGETDEAGMKTPAAWLAWRSGLSPERAGQIVRLAKVRDRYPVLFGAFERGEVSVDQMTELVKAPDWAQRQMLDFAEIGTVTRLRRAIRDDAFEGDPDTPPTHRCGSRRIECRSVFAMAGGGSPATSTSRSAGGSKRR